MGKTHPLHIERCPSNEWCMSRFKSEYRTGVVLGELNMTTILGQLSEDFRMQENAFSHQAEISFPPEDV